ncbi:MAG: sensor signal transduction histidine kinase [Chthonomonadales bacterium]|nr:sensor signal transduction histidine kinase [Chthonomonadales bacterium]
MPFRRTQTQNLQILNAIAEALNSASDIPQALQRTLALVAELLGLETGWVWLLDPETDAFFSAAALNLPPYLLEPLRMTGNACWCIESFRKGELTPRNIRIMSCSRLCTEVEEASCGRTGGLRYHASIPLTFQDKLLGIMNLSGPDWRRLTKDELRLLGTIGYQVGIALERARLGEASIRLARAEERTRIARDIHDTLAQGLTAIALHIESSLNHIEGNPTRARELLNRALVTTQESLEEARRSVLHLRASPLLNKPLAEALMAYGRAYTSETGIRVSIRVRGEVDLSPQRETEIFRIAQEAMANVRRHADATAVVVAIRQDSEAVRLVIHDDGIGCDTTKVLGTGHGIVGMIERARSVGGNCRLLSRPGRGVTVTVVIPLNESEGQSDPGHGFHATWKEGV